MTLCTLKHMLLRLYKSDRCVTLKLVNIEKGFKYAKYNNPVNGFD
jgi:hypothetical protein